MKRKWAVPVLCMGLLAKGAEGALHDRGGGLIYDDALNVTWLADANYAKTSGYDANGLMDWYQARRWADNLVYAGYDDWRLPTLRDGGLADYTQANYGTDYGYNVRTVGDDGTVFSELAYMYYVNLGFKAYRDEDGNVQDDWGIYRDGSGGVQDGDGYYEVLNGLGPNGVIHNLSPSGYWTGTESSRESDDPDNVLVKSWYFSFYGGSQGTTIRVIGRHPGEFAWALRDGDVPPVPEPLTATMFFSGLFVLAALTRRHMRSGK